MWGDDFDIVAVENDSRIADVYRQNFPKDIVVVGDAHKYLLENGDKFDFIWSSPACQSHSRMIRSGRNRTPRYPDLKLYEEILYLMHDFKGKWIVENVKPYYTPLVKPSVELGRHLVWSNFEIKKISLPKFDNFIKADTVAKAELLKEWIGIKYEGSIYYGNNHCPCQVLRNCVHPETGKHIVSEMMRSLS